MTSGALPRSDTPTRRLTWLAAVVASVMSFLPVLSSGGEATAAHLANAACTPATYIPIVIYVRPGLPGLTLAEKHLGNRTEENLPLPANLNVGTNRNIRYQAKACFLPDDTEVSFLYTLSGTRDTFYGRVKVPFIGDNEISCQFRQNGIADPYTPYGCNAVFESPPPVYQRFAAFTIGPRPKEVVTSPEQQAALATRFAESCQAGTPACSYRATSRKFIRAENKQISDWYNNCSDTERYSPEETWTTSATIENSFNFKVTVETGKILELFTKTSAEVQYNHKWLTTETYSFKLALPVPPKMRTAWFYAAGYDKITGDFTFIEGSSGPIYVLPDATVLLPNTMGVRSNPTLPYDPDLCGGNSNQLEKLSPDSLSAQ